jgi:glycosyltransferase involved in cell wall biosynthesis
MPRFVLIDHSLRKIGGHHYEYARHVLKAATGAGYEAVLAAHRDFEEGHGLELRSEAIYRLDYWGMASLMKPEGWLGRTVKWSCRRWFQLKTRLLFSPFGYLWLIRGNAVEHLSHHPLSSPLKRGWEVYLALAVLPVLAAAHVALKLVPFRQAIWRGLRAPFVGVARILKGMAAAMSRGGSLNRWMTERSKRQSFAADTAALFRRLKLGKGDVVFIPTLGVAEMLGVGEALRRFPDARGASLHLLFRRNVFASGEWSYQNEAQAVTPERNAFLRFRMEHADLQAFFYTDTQELSRQYEHLSTFRFRTCPIPHTVLPEECRSREGPLRLTYLGDARAEKGYDHFPALVAELRGDLLDTGKAEFHIQSNYNIRWGEPEAIVARSLLQAERTEQVRLYLKALGSADYEGLLRNADVIVLPYRRGEYFARSSGVVIEALAAGVPVVVPGGSWLGRQIASGVYAHRQRLKEGVCGRYETVGPDLVWDQISRGSVQAPALTGGLDYGGDDGWVSTTVKKPAGATHVFLTLAFPGLRGGQAVTVRTEHFDRSGDRLGTSSETLDRTEADSGVIHLARLLPETARVRISFVNAFANIPGRAGMAELGFLHGEPDGDTIPHSGAGVSYGTPEQIADSIREVVRHHDHYRQTARELGASIASFHNAKNLVRMLGCAAAVEDPCERGPARAMKAGGVR